MKNEDIIKKYRLCFFGEKKFYYDRREAEKDGMVKEIEERRPALTILLSRMKEQEKENAAIAAKNAEREKKAYLEKPIEDRVLSISLFGWQTCPELQCGVGLKVCSRYAQSEDWWIDEDFNYPWDGEKYIGGKTKKCADPVIGKKLLYGREYAHTYEKSGVRPVLHICYLVPGTVYEAFGHKWWAYDEDHMICEDILCRMPWNANPSYDSDYSYASSDIKGCLDGWLREENIKRRQK